MSGARLRVPMRPCECAHDLTPRRRPYGEASRGEPNLHTELARTADLRGRGGGEGIQPLCIEGCGVTLRLRVLRPPTLLVLSGSLRYTTQAIQMI